MNGLALCAGIGGIELGLKLALPEYRCVCYVERETYPAAVLVSRMEEGYLDEAPIWDDLETFDGRPWRGVVDIVSAGFPCPPVSCAGRRRGVEDDRWLWPEIVRIIRQVEPDWVFLENVDDLPTVNAGREYRDVLGSLAEMGFDVEWGVFSAGGMGAPHFRERVYVLAHAGRRRRRSQESEIYWGKSNPDRGNNRAGAPATIPDAACQRCQEFKGGRPNDKCGGVRTPARCGRWPPEPALPRVANGTSVELVRVRATGNTVVPRVVQVAFLELSRRIMTDLETGGN